MKDSIKWELTRDELSTIWYALVDRADRMYKEANAIDGKDKELAKLKRRIAQKCFDLYCQINTMKSRW